MLCSHCPFMSSSLLSVASAPCGFLLCVCDCTAFQLRKHKIGPLSAKAGVNDEHWGVNTLTQLHASRHYGCLVGQHDCFRHFSNKVHSAFVILMNFRLGYVKHCREDSGRAPSILAWKHIFFHSLDMTRHFYKTYICAHLLGQSKYLVIIFLFI